MVFSNYNAAPALRPAPTVGPTGGSSRPAGPAPGTPPPRPRDSVLPGSSVSVPASASSVPLRPMENPLRTARGDVSARSMEPPSRASPTPFQSGATTTASSSSGYRNSTGIPSSPSPSSGPGAFSPRRQAPAPPPPSSSSPSSAAFAQRTSSTSSPQTYPSDRTLGSPSRSRPAPNQSQFQPPPQSGVDLRRSGPTAGFGSVPPQSSASTPSSSYADSSSRSRPSGGPGTNVDAQQYRSQPSTSVNDRSLSPSSSRPGDSRRLVPVAVSTSPGYVPPRPPSEMPARSGEPGSPSISDSPRRASARPPGNDRAAFSPPGLRGQVQLAQSHEPFRPPPAPNSAPPSTPPPQLRPSGSASTSASMSGPPQRSTSPPPPNRPAKPQTPNTPVANPAEPGDSNDASKSRSGRFGWSLRSPSSRSMRSSSSGANGAAGGEDGSMSSSTTSAAPSSPPPPSFRSVAYEIVQPDNPAAQANTYALGEQVRADRLDDRVLGDLEMNELDAQRQGKGKGFLRYNRKSQKRPVPADGRPADSSNGMGSPSRPPPPLSPSAPLSPVALIGPDHVEVDMIEADASTPTSPTTTPKKKKFSSKSLLFWRNNSSSDDPPPPSATSGSSVSPVTVPTSPVAPVPNERSVSTSKAEQKPAPTVPKLAVNADAIIAARTYDTRPISPKRPPPPLSPKSANRVGGGGGDENDSVPDAPLKKIIAPRNLTKRERQKKIVRAQERITLYSDLSFSTWARFTGYFSLIVLFLHGFIAVTQKKNELRDYVAGGLSLFACLAVRYIEYVCTDLVINPKDKMYSFLYGEPGFRPFWRSFWNKFQNYYVRAGVYMALSVPTYFSYATIIGGVCLDFAAFVYLIAGIRKEHGKSVTGIG